MGQVSSYFQSNGFNFQVNYRGYLYFVELSLIHIIDNLEGFISNSEIYEFVRWGNQTISNKKLKELCKSEKILEYIFALNGFRKQLSAIRFKENASAPDFVKLAVIATKLSSKLVEINDYIIKKFNVKRKNNDKKLETMLVLDSVLNKYNYIKHQTDFFPDENGEREMKPLWPDSPFFCLMSPETERNYCLSYDMIKKKDAEYLMGYKLTLANLYEYLEPSFKQLKEDFLSQNNWFALHKSLNKVREALIGNYVFFNRRIFDMKDVKTVNPKIETGPVSTSEQLDLIFRGRDVRVIADRFDGDYPNTQNLFLHLLFGAITLYRMKRIKKPEIIEFKQVYQNGNLIEYTYAMYSAVGGSIWDSSHWTVFDKLTAESDYEPKPDFQYIYLNPIKKFYASDLNFTTIEVNGDVLRKYLEEKDIHLSIQKNRDEKLHEAIGMITEFLSFLYLSKTSDAKLLDIRKTIPNTDIDILAEDSKNIFVVQAKQEIPKTQQDFDLICANFTNAAAHLGSTKKPIKQILFVMRKVEMTTATVISSEQVIIDPRKIENKFKSKNVDVVYFQDLKKLINDTEHQELLDKLKLIFSPIKSRHFQDI